MTSTEVIIVRLLYMLADDTVSKAEITAFIRAQFDESVWCSDAIGDMLESAIESRG